MMSDRGFKYGSYQSALLHAWSGHSTVWFYNFNYRGEYTYGDHFAGTSNEIDFNWGKHLNMFAVLLLMCYNI